MSEQSKIIIYSFITICVVVFLLCWVPFFTMNLLLAFNLKFYSYSGISQLIFKLTIWLGYTNSCLNPFIYSAANNDFRNAFQNILMKPFITVRKWLYLRWPSFDQTNKFLFNYRFIYCKILILLFIKLLP